MPLTEMSSKLTSLRTRSRPRTEDPPEQPNTGVLNPSEIDTERCDLFDRTDSAPPSEGAQ